MMLKFRPTLPLERFCPVYMQGLDPDQWLRIGHVESCREEDGALSAVVRISADMKNSVDVRSSLTGNLPLRAEAISENDGWEILAIAVIKAKADQPYADEISQLRFYANKFDRIREHLKKMSEG